ncbi:hypothetical protein Pflav_048940 [Phytohabitans flavus]|uniref:Uncharacterized protein n=1 Tax=Phytohabitans flavus TaxID=1076124 RepID=A0A6F8XXA6_9ACTN|nr:hypothetical protein Pflav_048940 [Phytohabitans flavus]
MALVTDAIDERSATTATPASVRATTLTGVDRTLEPAGRLCLAAFVIAYPRGRSAGAPATTMLA